jgi:WD40 repeat protein
MAIGFDEALLVYELPNFDRTSFFGLDATKAVAFCPANSYLAATNSRGAVAIWNLATNRQFAALAHPVSDQNSEDLTFSEDGGALAACNASSLQIWDLKQARERTVLQGHAGAVPGAAFRPDGKVLATAGADDEVRLWNPATGALISSLPIGEKVQSVAFSADGEHLIVGSQGRTEAPHLRLIEIATGKVLHEQNTDFGNVFSLAWVDRPEASALAACGDGSVALWRVTQASSAPMTQLLRLPSEWCLAVCLNSQGSKVAWAEKGDQVKAWDLAADRELPVTAPPMQSGWHGLSFLPDGDTIAYIAKSGVAELWNLQKDARVATLGTPGTFFSSHMAVSMDGSLLAAMTQPDVVSVWHVPTGKHVYSLRVEGGAVWSLAWDPRGEQLAVGQSDGGLSVWRLPIIRQALAEAGLEWHASQ